MNAKLAGCRLRGKHLWIYSRFCFANEGRQLQTAIICCHKSQTRGSGGKQTCVL